MSWAILNSDARHIPLRDESVQCIITDPPYALTQNKKGVFDPFAGSGTTVLVADKLNRIGVGIELKWEYYKMSHRRCYDDAPLLVGEA